MNQILNQRQQTPKLIQELEICVFGAAEGSLPQVMVPEGGSEAKNPAENLVVIFFLTYYLKEGTNGSKLSHNQSNLYCYNGNASTKQMNN